MMVKLVASLTEFGDRADLFLDDLPATIVREDGGTAFLGVDDLQWLRAEQWSSVRDTGIFQCEGHGDGIICGVDLSVWPQGALWPADFDA